MRDSLIFPPMLNVHFCDNIVVFKNSICVFINKQHSSLNTSNYKIPLSWIHIIIEKYQTNYYNYNRCKMFLSMFIISTNEWYFVTLHIAQNVILFNYIWHITWDLVVMQSLENFMLILVERKDCTKETQKQHIFLSKFNSIYE